jgi:hypothetical protein
MSDVVCEPAPDLDAILADTGRIEAALRSAVRGALRDHKQAGNPIAVWRDGRVVWLPPEEIPEDVPSTSEPAP